MEKQHDPRQLAARIEGLEGPNYAVEVEIFKALHPEYAGYVQGRGGLVHPCDGSDVRVLSDVRPGNYTASIDAALRLVPKGAMRRSGDSAIGLMGTFFCDIVLEDGRDFHAIANNEPCAIACAAIRARAAMLKENEGG